MGGRCQSDGSAVGGLPHSSACSEQSSAGQSSSVQGSAEHGRRAVSASALLHCSGRQHHCLLHPAVSRLRRRHYCTPVPAG